MGGNIEFVTQTRRYPKDDFYELTDDACWKLNNILVNGYNWMDDDCIFPLESYRNKDSFGDLDILILSQSLPVNWIELLVTEFNLRVGDWSKNGNVFSFVFRNCQVDLIVTPEEEFRTSYDYFNYNDLGNLLGRITKKLGLKLGHKGTEFIVRDGDQVLGEILVTKKFSEILDLIGLSYEEYNNGFDDAEDIFKFVAKSKYFNPDIYLLHNRNHYSRTRDAKRKTYHAFLEWCKTQTFDDVYPYEDVTEKSGYGLREPFFTEVVIKRWPHVKVEYDKIIERHLKNKEFKEKFNGETVMKITGLEGKELGAFMSWARDSLERTNTKHLFTDMDFDLSKILTESLYFHYKNNFVWLAITPEQVRIMFPKSTITVKTEE